MLLTEGGWIRYHEAVCSAGPPWKCEKQCALWSMWEAERKRGEAAAAKRIAQGLPPYPTYADLQRKP